jgi:enamine deaminase RidA (YjgF/YER057c/UK114 family)
MQTIVERAGYAPAVKVGQTLYCAGQVGRTADLQVIEDPEEQFIAA